MIADRHRRRSRWFSGRRVQRALRIEGRDFD